MALTNSICEIQNISEIKSAVSTWALANSIRRIKCKFNTTENLQSYFGQVAWPFYRNQTFVALTNFKIERVSCGRARIKHTLLFPYLQVEKTFSTLNLAHWFTTHIWMKPIWVKYNWRVNSFYNIFKSKTHDFSDFGQKNMATKREYVAT